MHIAIIGAGPIGIEAALAADEAGHSAVVYEAGEVGQALRDWGHIRLFTTWSMNTTARGRARLGTPLPEGCPTGAEMVRAYLEPLAAGLDVRTGHRLVGATRGSLRKPQSIGSESRARAPFRLLFDTPDGEVIATADAVLDCTGVTGQPNPAGIGGLPAKGERALAARGLVHYGFVQPEELRGQTVAVLGAGATGATLVTALVDAGQKVTWLTGEQAPSFDSPADDRLPERRALYQAASRALDAVDWVRSARVTSLDAEGSGICITLDDGRRMHADQLVVATGFRPDLAPTRELQIHHCYASEGPMKLAAALLASSGGGGDCLDQVSQGAEVLATPEPRFFVLGAKSYGRRNDFLLQVGHAQVEDVIGLLGSP